MQAQALDTKLFTGDRKLIEAFPDIALELGSLGFEEIQASGSRVKFRNPELDLDINLHKPHPGNEVKAYAVRQIQDLLAQEGLI